MAEITIEGIISIAMTVVFVIAGAYLVSTIFSPSGEEYGIMAMRDIASFTNKIDTKDDGFFTQISESNCKDFRINVPKGFRIGLDGEKIILEKDGIGIINSVNMPHELFVPDELDEDDDFNSRNNNFPINHDFSDNIDEEVCICKKGGKNIMFPQPKALGIIEYCNSGANILSNAAIDGFEFTKMVVT